MSRISCDQRGRDSSPRRQAGDSRASVGRTANWQRNRKTSLLEAAPDSAFSFQSPPPHSDLCRCLRRRRKGPSWGRDGFRGANDYPLRSFVRIGDLAIPSEVDPRREGDWMTDLSVTARARKALTSKPPILSPRSPTTGKTTWYGSTSQALSLAWLALTLAYARRVRRCIARSYFSLAVVRPRLEGSQDCGPEDK